MDLNEYIEKNLGVYWNYSLTEYSSELNDKSFCIGSLESYLYGKKNNKIYQDFHNNFYIINKELRNKKNIIHSDFDKILNSSPLLKQNFIVYRGIPKKIDVKVNDILDNLGYLFTSIQKNYAEFFATHDTLKCYTKDYSIINMDKAEKINKIGTLFKIEVSLDKHFFNNCWYSFDWRTAITEIIFEKNHQLKIISINQLEKYQYIEAILI